MEATGAQAQGAYILDTLLNYDKRPGSQGFSKVCYLLKVSLLGVDSLWGDHLTVWPNFEVNGKVIDTKYSKH